MTRRTKLLAGFSLRQRKEAKGEKRYSVLTMSDELDISNFTVDALQRSNPAEAVRFFLNWRLACAGCGFARFCTLAGVARIYQLNEAEFFKEARNLVAPNT